MQRPEGFYGETIPHDGTDHSISAIFFLSQPIAMVNPGIPSGDVAAPRSDVILDTDILAKNVVSPAIVVAGDEKDWQSRLAQFGKRCKSAKAVAGYYRFPFEPEIEEVTVDDERTRMTSESSQERNELSLDVERSNAKMRVGNNVAR